MINPLPNRGKIISTLCAAIFIALMASSVFAAQKYPSPRGAVNDFANVIDQDNAAKMEALAREVLEKTGTAVVVVTVPTYRRGRRNQSLRQWSL